MRRMLLLALLALAVAPAAFAGMSVSWASSAGNASRYLASAAGGGKHRANPRRGCAVGDATGARQRIDAFFVSKLR